VTNLRRGKYTPRYAVMYDDWLSNGDDVITDVSISSSSTAECDVIPAAAYLALRN